VVGVVAWSRGRAGGLACSLAVATAFNERFGSERKMVVARRVEFC
jgi:hypothetical protein